MKVAIYAFVPALSFDRHHKRSHKWRGMALEASAGAFKSCAPSGARMILLAHLRWFYHRLISGVPPGRRSILRLVNRLLAVATRRRRTRSLSLPVPYRAGASAINKSLDAVHSFATCSKTELLQPENQTHNSTIYRSNHRKICLVFRL